MKYVPKYQELIIETVTTANKNIQGYFMRTDQSYYVPELCRHIHGQPNSDTSQLCIPIIIDNARIQINTDVIETDIFTNCAYNIDKYETYNNCQDKLYSILYQKLFKSETKYGIPVGDDSSTPLGTGDKFNPGELSIQLIFCDFIGRSDLISIIDIFLNHMNFKEIILFPLSLAISFSLGQNYCSFIYPMGFSFIDDFMLADSFSPEITRRCNLDDEDFVEEFSRLKPLDETQKYVCVECECREGSEEKINVHIEKEHPGGTFFYYTDSSILRESYDNRVKYLFGREKATKIMSRIFSIGTNFAGATPIEDIYTLGIRGAQLYSALECSKDCWMTAKEWQSVRLRVLKEKLLFFI